MEEFNYPPTDSQFPAWLNNFRTKLEPYLAVISISAAEFDKLTVIKDAMVFCENRIDAYEASRTDFVRTRQIILYGDETNPLLGNVSYEVQPRDEVAPAEAPSNSRPFINNLVQRTRICPALNEMQKKEMGVLPKPRPTSDLQAVLKGEVVNGLPTLECRLLGQNGYEVWRKTTGASDFVYFDRSAASTYIDQSSLPDGLAAVQYDYKVRLIGPENEPVSDFSNVVTLTKTAG